MTPLRSPRPPRCIKCGRPFRDRGERLADRPGTQAHAGRGLCTQDYRVARGELPKNPDLVRLEEAAEYRPTLEQMRRDVDAWTRGRRLQRFINDPEGRGLVAAIHRRKKQKDGGVFLKAVTAHGPRPRPLCV